MKLLEKIGRHLPETPVLCMAIAIIGCGVILLRGGPILANASEPTRLPDVELQADNIPLEVRRGTADDIPVIEVTEDTLPDAEPEVPDGYDIPAAATSFKAWMSYRAITDKHSDQWKLQENAWTDGDGFRRYGDEGYYMVAMGTYYASRCGKVFDVTFESGETIRCIIGDIKADAHTDSLHQHRNGNVVEFIVDGKAISKTCRRMGDMSYAEGVDLTGKPIKIVEVG